MSTPLWAERGPIGARPAVALGILVIVITAGCIGGPATTPDAAGSDGRAVETYELTTPDGATASAKTAGPPTNVTVVALAGGVTTILRPPEAPPIVIDTGRDPNATRLRRVLDAGTVDRIGVLLTSSPTDGDVGGAATLVRRYDPRNAAHNGRTRNSTAYNRYLRAIVDHGLQHDFYHVTNETRFGWGAGRTTILAPAPPSGAQAPERPVVLAYEVHGRRVLHLGNASPAAQASLLRRNRSALTATVLVADDDRTVTPAFRRAVDPTVTVLGSSVATNGANGSTGGPNRSVVVLGRGDAATIRIHPNGTLTGPRPETPRGQPRQATA